MRRKQVHDGSHLTLEEREIIESGIKNGSTKVDIARTIGKDATTVAKEIRKHRQFQPRTTYGREIICTKQGLCKKQCYTKCPDLEVPTCNRRDKSPGACNNCDKNRSCKMDKYYYHAADAHKEYLRDLVDTRAGFDITDSEIERIGKIIAPLLNKGQSVHQVLSAHPEIGLSEKSLYTYIESDLFKKYDVTVFSLKEKVNRKYNKATKPRKEKAHYTGRKYEDFLEFCKINPDVPVTEMDTVYNNPSGPYLQTIIFENTAFMIGFLHKERTSESMASRISWLQEKLKEQNGLFFKLFSLLLVDRGPEFEKWSLFEQDTDGKSRLNIFYCDPQQSQQKPHVENNHNYVRDIIPNNYPLTNLTQEDIDIMFSHINSTPRRSLEDKSPYEAFTFFYGENAATLLNIKNIPRDEVVLKPELIFNKHNKK